MSGITDSVTTSLTQAYVGHKTDEIKQEVMNLVGMGDNGDNFQDEENQASSSSSNNKRNRTLWTSAVFVTAATGFGINIFVMLIFSATVVYVMGILTMVLATAVVYSELQLEDLPCKLIRSSSVVEA